MEPKNLVGFYDVIEDELQIKDSIFGKSNYLLNDLPFISILT